MTANPWQSAAVRKSSFLRSPVLNCAKFHNCKIGPSFCLDKLCDVSWCFRRTLLQSTRFVGVCVMQSNISDNSTTGHKVAECPQTPSGHLRAVHKIKVRDFPHAITGLLFKTDISDIIHSFIYFFLDPMWLTIGPNKNLGHNMNRCSHSSVYIKQLCMLPCSVACTQSPYRPRRSRWSRRQK